ncbi:Ig-like domain-containing protein [Paenibacillus flagellatus]|uniref:Cadherin domain-containing protein n=1 Tax=Paenibacillus flagellatus TaxID=2211139 RepID=A0A2V5K9U0_9BACL|nr:hypothetical protein [Paenibacillus flagellatus]PYI56281.1 hypothetical protein DLM86_04665 [Paenibacillus flagellatus]
MGRIWGKLSGTAGKPRAAALLAASISVAPIAPALAAPAAPGADPIGDITGTPGETVLIDLKKAFGEPYTSFHVIGPATSAGVVSTARSGSMLRLHLDGPGMATFTVTAQNDEMAGSVNDTFTVRVIGAGDDGRTDVGDVVRFMRDYPEALTERSRVSDALHVIKPLAAANNRTPTATSAVFEMAVKRGGTVNDVPLSVFGFADPDGETLAYYVAPAAAGGLTASIVGGSVVFSGLATDEASFGIVAEDARGASTAAILTVKPNSAPVTTVTGVTYSVYAPLTPEQPAFRLELGPLFRDADGDPLAYAISPAEAGGVSAAILGSAAHFAGVLGADTAFLVRASDPHGDYAELALELKTRPGTEPANRSPSVAQAVYDKAVPFGGTPAPIELRGNFSDPDGDVLTFGVSPASQGGLTATVEDGELWFAGSIDADAAFAVTASDGKGGTATATYRYSANRAPYATKANPKTVTYIPGETFANKTLDIAADFGFTDPEADPIAYRLDVPSSSIPESLSAVVDGSVLTLNGPAGPASIVVDAADGIGNHAQATYRIVPNYPVVAAGPEHELLFADTAEGAGLLDIDLTDYFSDADETGLAFEIVSEGSTIPENYEVVLDGSTVYLRKDAESPPAEPMTETIVVKIRAYDEEGAEAFSTFTFRPVANHAPVSHLVEKYGFTPDALPYTFDLSKWFTDEDPDDALSYSVSITTNSVVGEMPWLSLSSADNRKVQVRDAGASPTAHDYLSATVTDRYGASAGAANVRLQSWMPEHQPSAKTIVPGAELRLNDLHARYTFANGWDELTGSTRFTVGSSDPELVTAAMDGEGKDLILTAVGGTGTAEITIVGTDEASRAGIVDRFLVTVAAPSAGMSQILVPEPSDDGEQYYSATVLTSPPEAGFYSPTAGQLSLSVEGTGAATFTITIPNETEGGPSTVYTVPYNRNVVQLEDRAIAVDSRLDIVDLYKRFNNAAITASTTFTVTSSDPDKATAVMDGTNLRIDALSATNSGTPVEIAISGHDPTTGQSVSHTLKIRTEQSLLEALIGPLTVPNPFKDRETDYEVVNLSGNGLEVSIPWFYYETLSLQLGGVLTGMTDLLIIGHYNDGSEATRYYVKYSPLLV